jgi:solute carrier family 25 phosphate transporter 23/24/25/41
LLVKSELQLACRQAGLLISNRKVDEFFAAVDVNHDGVVTFEEWRQVRVDPGKRTLTSPRDFLLFLPSHANLESVFAYYAGSTFTVNHEGDVHITHDTSQSRGTLATLLAPFVASLLLVAQPPSVQRQRQRQLAARSSPPPDVAPAFVIVPQVTAAEPAVLPPVAWSDWESVKPVLTACLPSTGYFAAGALAGTISRTATAPLDRLKVYLIAQTKSPFGGGTKTGLAIVRPLLSAWNSTSYAVRDLWAAGGLRSLYAGRFARPLARATLRDREWPKRSESDA